MKLAWATDIHLNFVDQARASRFCAEVVDSGAEALLLGGDIAEAPDLEEWLRFLEARVAFPTYFVLGNHDYYAGSVAAVESQMRSFASKRVRYLGGASPVALTPATGLVGHGGWGDAGNGDFLRSPVTLSDYVLIEELRESSGSDDPLAVMGDRPALQRVLRRLGDDAARELAPALRQALADFPHVVVLTHVPPFSQAARHRGAPCGDDWLPGMTCRAIGDLLLEEARAHPAARLTVLCGHTHSDAEARILPNLEVRAQGADYGDPRFRRISID
jgi:3',5'-cyclic AMP phosphodiesterase CpdA